MKGKTVKILAVVLAALMVLGVIPIIAFAAETRAVTLDGEPGNFDDDDAYPGWNYSREVTLTADGRLPRSLPVPKYGSYRLLGWSEAKMTETRPDDTGEFWVWKLVKNGKLLLHPGDEVPEGTDTLYPVFEMPNADGYRKITFYYDWNGINGMSGHCLKCTRDLGYKYTDGIVFGLNYSMSDPASVLGDLDDESKYGEVQSKLESYWQSNAIQGKNGFGRFYFDGWYTEPDGGEKIKPGTVLTNGQSLYAHWHKAELKAGNETAEPKDPRPGSVPEAELETSDTRFGANMAESKTAVKDTGVIKDEPETTPRENGGEISAAEPQVTEPGKRAEKGAERASAVVAPGNDNGAVPAEMNPGNAVPAAESAGITDGNTADSVVTAAERTPKKTDDAAKTVVSSPEGGNSYAVPIAVAVGAAALCGVVAVAAVFRGKAVRRRDGNADK